MTIQFTPGDDIPFGLVGAEEGNVDDVPFEPENLDSIGGLDPLLESLDDDDDVESAEEDDDELFLSTPGEVKVVEQAVRTAPDGRQVVDIVLEIEDVDGADNYEVRITK